MAAISEEALRDAWARWAEARPEWADWKLRMEMRAPSDWVWLEGSRGMHKQGLHELHVELLEPIPISVRLFRDGGRLPPVRPSEDGDEFADGYSVLMRWVTGPERAVQIVDALTEAMRERDLMDHLRGPRVSGAERRLELFVWDRLLGRA